jgi:hypothetical protein
MENKGDVQDLRIGVERLLKGLKHDKSNWADIISQLKRLTRVAQRLGPNGHELSLPTKVERFQLVQEKYKEIIALVSKPPGLDRPLDESTPLARSRVLAETLLFWLYVEFDLDLHAGNGVEVKMTASGVANPTTYDAMLKSLEKHAVGPNHAICSQFRVIQAIGNIAAHKNDGSLRRTYAVPALLAIHNVCHWYVTEVLGMGAEELPCIPRQLLAGIGQWKAEPINLLFESTDKVTSLLLPTNAKSLREELVAHRAKRDFRAWKEWHQTNASAIEDVVEDDEILQLNNRILAALDQVLGL